MRPAKLYKTPENGIIQKGVSLSSDEEIHFSGSDTAPEYILLYCHYTSLNRLGEFFEIVRKGGLEKLIEEYYADGKIIIGSLTMAIGDWCVMLDPDSK